MQQMIEYQQTRMAVNMEMTRQSDNVKLFEVVAEKDSQEIKFIFHVSFVPTLSNKDDVFHQTKAKAAVTFI